MSKTSTSADEGVGRRPGDAKPIQPGAIQDRLNSLDQFRGYTVAGMILVNFVGGYAVIDQQLPILKHHNTYCSYADTIMPQFFFAVGYSLRLSLLRRTAKSGWSSSVAHQLQRFFLLLVVSFVVYHFSITYKTWEEAVRGGWSSFLQNTFHRQYFQTLTHIAFTSLWLLPVAAAGWRWRVFYLLFTTGLYGYSLYAGYGRWVWDHGGIDGGPLGFLSWSVPTLLGTFAYDMMQRGWKVRGMFGLGALFALVGYLASCLTIVTPPQRAPSDFMTLLQQLPIPFLPSAHELTMWTMSQKSVTLTYTYFSGGLSLMLFSLFVWGCDRYGWGVSAFRTLGTNALAAYILHMMVIEAVRPIFPRSDSPLVVVFVAFAITFALNWFIMRHLEKQKLILKL